jgi:competence protein ComK
MALVPTRNTDYYTIVHELQQTIYVKKTPFEIIQSACLQNYSSYAGRRDAVIHHTGYTRKVPIPIDFERSIIAFPTLSPTNFDCVWIFYRHIERFTSIQKNKGTFITFRNDMELSVGVSCLVLEKQVYRTVRCLSIKEYRT